MGDRLLAGVEHFGRDMSPSVTILVEERKERLEVDDPPLRRILLDFIVEDILEEHLLQILFDISNLCLLAENLGKSFLLFTFPFFLSVAFITRHSVLR